MTHHPAPEPPEPTHDERATLRALAEAATPGPWGAEDYSCVAGTAQVFSWGAGWPTIDRPLKPEDAAFIAAANPTAVLALLDRLDAAEAHNLDERAVRLALDVGRLTRERDALLATVARVEALADEWAAPDMWPGGRARVLTDWGVTEYQVSYHHDHEREGYGKRLRAALESPR